MEKGHSARLEKVENMIRLINRMADLSDGQIKLSQGKKKHGLIKEIN